ncbi:C-type lectin domain family 4 member A-like isoform X2 [Meriones unguiculatus]|uniref:C-type lectin domain family 4 member A-like isoform X2 n=1 Tax=Meriones unguiculatus TaxID=10047 RepID=UPI00293F5E23|nr:C-type lectin domain family 4 member A-like isoform X2 [Meriones unguiculatus]
MASEITYAEVKFKNASNSSGTHSDSSAAPKGNPTHHQIYFQKYSQLLEEKKATKYKIIHNKLSCMKNSSLMDGKAWSCCPKDWKPFGSNCYFISTSPAASWNESEKKCSSKGAHLLVIHSKEEQDFITKNLEQKAAYYIGLWGPGHRQWQWVDKSPYNESAAFWHKGEPNNVWEKCVVLHHRPAGWGWNDVLCNYIQSSVCQMNKIYL